ncbi:MAG: ABC transporter ATP-binding protein [Clostridiales bacterium]|nr:ABC transporter ATP-binding protein [Clostridiales bacterium]
MIEVKNLVKKYGNHIAVDHLSFTVQDGQIYGFLGPNGAGKSTTMNIMTGYIGATEGEVIINGHNILTEPEKAKRSIGYLPEIPPLYVDMTVLEYLTFAAELKKIKASERKQAIEQSIQLTKLDDVKHRLIKNLSKGYKQRVGLAQAVLGMPDVIVLDEPTVGLDPIQIIEIRDLIRELAKRHTVILSSHILSEVSAVCDHIMIISHGKLVASDTPDNLMQMMKGGHTLEVVVKGDKQQVRAVLDSYDYEELEHADICDGEEDGTTAVSFPIGAEQRDYDIREVVFYAFAQNRCPIVMMQLKKASLEQVFMELTMDEAKENDKNNDIREEAEQKAERLLEEDEKSEQEDQENESDL